MIITPVKTPLITAGSHKLEELLAASLPAVPDYSIVAITSKIVSLCQNRVVAIQGTRKEDLVRKHAQYYLDPESNPYGITLTITRDLLIPTAGIDESNGNGQYILWPDKPYDVAARLRTFLSRQHRLDHVGVLITDSHTTPMRWGTTGIALAYAGFRALNDYIGKPDLFGRAMTVTKANIADGLAAAAVVCTGETNEQTPLAVISGADAVHFDPAKPSEEERRAWHIPIDADLYGPLLQAAPWKKGKGD